MLNDFAQNISHYMMSFKMADKVSRNTAEILIRVKFVDPTSVTMGCVNGRVNNKKFKWMHVWVKAHMRVSLRHLVKIAF